MKRQIGFVLAAAILSTAPVESQDRREPPNAHEWPQYKGGSGLTGTSADSSIRPPLKLLWSYRTDGDTSGDAGGGVIVAGGKVFVNVTNTRSILALDAEDGRLLWEYTDLNLEHSLVPSYGDGRLYVWKNRLRTSEVAALDANTGKVLWQTSLKPGDVHRGRFGVPVHAGKVFCAEGGDDPTVVALEEATGKIAWRAPLGTEDGRTIVPPSAAGGRVFVSLRSSPRSTPQGAVVALSSDGGKILWRRKNIFSYRPMTCDGLVVGCTMAYSTEAKTHFLDAKTGETIWSSGGSAGYSPVTLTDTLALLHPWGVDFFACDRKTGKEIWRFDTKGTSGCSTPSVSGDFAYFGTGLPGRGDSEAIWAWNRIDAPEKGVGCTVHAVDLKTGRSIWSFGTGNNVCGDPALAYGRLYFNSRDGRIYCLAPAPVGGPTVPETKDASPSAPPADVKALIEAPAESSMRADERGITLNLPLEVAWKFDAGGPVLSGASIRDGRVYVGSDAGRIFAVDVASGRKAWEFATGGKVRCSPAVAGGLVYVGSDGGKFHAIDAASGEERWCFETGGPVQASPSVVGDVVVFGANDHHVYALERKTGRKLWSFHAGYYSIQAPPVVHGNRVFVAPWTEWVYALDLATGKPQWRSYVPVTIEALAYSREKLWVRSPYYVVELDPATGKRERLASAPYGYGRPAFVGHRLFLSGTRGQYGPAGAVVVDIDEPGDEIKKYPLLEDVRLLRSKSLIGGSSELVAMPAPLALGDKVCFAARSGKVVITEPDGKPVWSHPLGGTCHAEPVAAEGLLVVGCDDGFVYAFREKRQ